MAEELSLVDVQRQVVHRDRVAEPLGHAVEPNVDLRHAHPLLSPHPAVDAIRRPA